jgi:transposase
MDAKKWKLRMPRPRQRLEERRKAAVQLVISGNRTPSEVAREIGVNRTTVQAWLKAYREGGGLRALKASRHPGRERFLSEEQSQELRKFLMEGAQAHGFDSDLWTSPRVQAVIRKRFGIQHGISTIPRILRRLGLSPQKPESRAIERDERGIRRWVREDFERIKKGPEAGRDDHLYR